MFIDKKTLNQLAKYYIGELPVDGIRFTMSLFRNGKFSAHEKAEMTMKILYLDNLLQHEYITRKGWNTIQSQL